MSDIVDFPFTPAELVYLDYAQSNYDSAMDLLNGLSGFSLLCSCMALYVMVRMKVYQHSLMGLIFVMTFLQTVYDASLFSTFCGNPAVSQTDGAGIQSKTWTQCRSIQMGIVRGTGVGVGICTNVISAVVAYVIYFEKRLPLNYTSLAIVVLVPSIAVGILFGQFFFEQTEKNGLKGYLGGQDNFNIINFVYIAISTLEFAINVVCVLYISLHFYRGGLLCARRQPSANMQIARLDQNSLKLHNKFDFSDSENRGSEASVGRFTGGPLGGARSSTASASARDSLRNATQRERFVYPMFLLAKRLMLYPAVQSLVIFGGSFYAYAQGGEATESYIWNVTSNPARQMQTIQLYFFCVLMPLAGFGYFLVFMTFQKGAWKLLIETFTKELPALFGLPACSCGWLFSSDVYAKERASIVTDMSSATSVIESGESGGGWPTDAASSPNPYAHAGYGIRAPDRISKSSQSSPGAETQLYSPLLPAPIPAPPVGSPTSPNSRAFSPRVFSGVESPSLDDRSERSRDDVESRVSYTYEGSEQNRESVAGSAQEGHYSNQAPRMFQHDSRTRQDSVAYYEERMHGFRQKANTEKSSIAQLMSAEPDLCDEDIDEMQEDELIDLIEIASAQKKEARRLRKENRIDTANRDSDIGSCGDTSDTVSDVPQNPMH